MLLLLLLRTIPKELFGAFERTQVKEGNAQVYRWETVMIATADGADGGFCLMGFVFFLLLVGDSILWFVGKTKLLLSVVYKRELVR